LTRKDWIGIRDWDQGPIKRPPPEIDGEVGGTMGIGEAAPMPLEEGGPKRVGGPDRQQSGCVRGKYGGLLGAY